MRPYFPLVAQTILKYKTRLDQNNLILKRYVHSSLHNFSFNQSLVKPVDNNIRFPLMNSSKLFKYTVMPHQNLWSSLKGQLLLKPPISCHSVCHLHSSPSSRCDIPQYLAGSISEVEIPEEEDEMENLENEMQDEIIEFLSSRAIVFEETDSSFVVECPTCRGTQGKHPNAQDIFVDKHTGYYVCPWCCGAGSWKELCEVLDARSDCLTQAQLDSVLETTLPITNASASVLAVTSYRSLDVSTLQRFGCRLTSDCSRLIVPVRRTLPLHQASIDNTQTVVGYYAVVLLQPDTKVVCRFLKGQASAWSSLNCLDRYTKDASPSTMVVVSHICEALYLAYLGIPAVTIPNNVVDWQHFPASRRYNKSDNSNDPTSSAGSSQTHHRSNSNRGSGTSAITPNVWGLGEDVQRVVMWLTSSNSLPQRFYAHLSRSNLTSSAVSPAGNAPLYFLKRNHLRERLQGDLLKLLSGKFITIRSVKDKIYQRITHKEEACGVPWRRFPELQAVLLGHRPGEVTVLSGPTGAGKTTFAAEYSLDLAIQGVPTLWASLEVSVMRLCEVLLQQFSGAPLPADEHQYETLLQHFEQLPLHFLDLHGQQDLEEVIQVVREGAVVLGGRHVIIDNLQFLVGCQENSQERWMVQDRAMASFRNFATQHCCHVTLIVHPRKLQPSEVLTMQSVGGSAKVTQEADNVLLLQVQGSKAASTKKAIEVVKNRYGGHLGVVPLKFDRESLTFSNCFKRSKDDRKKHSRKSS